MSKYASLPDIDTAPDVYETPDLPTIHITERDDDSDNEGLPAGSHAQQHKGTASSDIIKDTLDQSSARKKFGSASGLDAANADFSGSLLRKQPRRSSARYPPPTTRRTFDTDQYSILPRGYAIDQHPGVLEHETPLERLRRLRFEVDQLEEELEQEKPSPDSVAAQPDDHGDGQSDSAPPPTSTLKGKARAAPTPTELLVELQHLRQQLEKLAVSAASSDPLSTSESQLRAREAYAKSLLHQLTQRGPKAQEASASQPAEPVPPAVSRATACAQLDTRLSVLEDLLGSRSLLQASGTGDITLPPPLLVTIGKLEHQLSLLTQPRHLDSISRRVKVIVTDLERVHEARRKLTDNRPLSIALASGITVVTQAPSGASSQPSVNTSLGNLPGVISGSQDPTQPNLPPDALHKLERLYSLLPRLDPLLPLVPHLLSRLRSLAELHTSAAQFRDRLDLSVADVKHLAARASQLAQLLDLLENNFHANENVIQKNLALVGQRIEKLFESIDLLKSSS
ncbi:hypothetical protein PCASD_25030 [Puccinia coronata f. sp. avenae]|uniref:Dynactin subunit 2 n=1 Tax=Puccinia coronata f. sp. avenae TaxID=200324 RepID=A0A2N5SLN6_9BASI|nr:hypothetical protein PCASD_25030 [Puccinia coronata f. sp. avenae]